MPTRDWGQWGDATFMALFAVGVALAGALGGAFNFINGWVSPDYFVSVMHWTLPGNVWWACIRQGITEGLVRGAILSAVFSLGLAAISRGKCPFGLGLRFLMGIFAAVSLFWTFGGIIAMLTASKYTPFQWTAFINSTDEIGQTMRDVWVQGSIRATYEGSVLSVLGALMMFRKCWKYYSSTIKFR